MFRLRLVSCVAAARIFFHCHYIGDTIVGAIVGTLVTYGLAILNVKSLADAIAHQMMIIGSDIDMK